MGCTRSNGLRLTNYDGLVVDVLFAPYKGFGFAHDLFCVVYTRDYVDVLRVIHHIHPGFWFSWRVERPPSSANRPTDIDMVTRLLNEHKCAIAELGT